MANNDALARLVVTIGANTAEFAKSMQQTTSGLKNFSNQIAGIASSLGIAFGVREVASFGLEVSKLAGEAEGVLGAFERLPNASKVMEGLKEATGNTVSELDLMKAAVQANNFQIPIENLASLFKFATLRAQQTGQSVDYLVQSIILGIGRKSPLILDNLGISAVRLREKLKGVSAEAATVGDVAKVVGDIASESLQDMAGFSQNAATGAQQLSAAWTNFEVALGGASNESGVLGDSMANLVTIIQSLTKLLNGEASSALSNYLKLVTIVPATTLKAGAALLEMATHQDTLTESVQGFNDKLKDTPFFNFTIEGIAALNNLRKMAEEAGKKLVLLSDDTGRTVLAIKDQAVATVQASAANDKLTITYQGLQEQLKVLNELFEKADVTDKNNLATIGQKIIAIDSQIKKLNELRKANEDQATGLAAVRQELAQVTKELESANLSDEARLNTLRQQKQALEELIAAQDRLNKKKQESIIIDTSAVPLSKLFELPSMEKTLSDLDLLTAKFRQAHAAATGVFDEIKKGTIDIGPALAGLVTGVADALGSVTDKQRNFGQDILATLAGFAQQFGTLLITMGVAKVALDEFTSGPAMIVAGVALVAAGAAIKGLVANRSTGSSSGATAVSNSNSALSSATGGIVSLIRDGEWRISGRDLVFVYDKNKGLDGSRRG